MKNSEEIEKIMQNAFIILCSFISLNYLDNLHGTEYYFTWDPVEKKKSLYTKRN